MYELLGRGVEAGSGTVEPTSGKEGTMSADREVSRRLFLGALGAGSLARRAEAAAKKGDLPTTSRRVEKLFKAPGEMPNGLQTTADGLWVLDQKETNKTERRRRVDEEGAAVCRTRPVMCVAVNVEAADSQGGKTAQVLSQPICCRQPDNIYRDVVQSQTSRVARDQGAHLFRVLYGIAVRLNAPTRPGLGGE